MRYIIHMKKGDVVKFVSPPGLHHLDSVMNWKQQSPGLVVGSKDTSLKKRSYEVLWRNGETTFEWESYLEIISKA